MFANAKARSAGSFSLRSTFRQSTVGIGDVDDLIESRDRVTHMLCVGQWFFTLLRKRVDAVWQVALRREPSVFLVRFPSCFWHVFAILSSIFG